MKYNFVVDKIRKVVYSCETFDQIDAVYKYCNLLIPNGAMANQYFCYFDLKKAEAVTSSGQLAIKSASENL